METTDNPMKIRTAKARTLGMTGLKNTAGGTPCTLAAYHGTKTTLRSKSAKINANAIPYSPKPKTYVSITARIRLRIPAMIVTIAGTLTLL